MDEILQKLTRKTNRRGTEYWEDTYGNVVAKRCTKCGEAKLLTEYNRCIQSLGGVLPSCKNCKAKYRLRNREKIAESQRDYYVRNREKLVENQKEYSREYYVRNREKVIERHRDYCVRNREKYKAIVQRRRARLANLPDDWSLAERLETYNHFGGCALTGSSDIHWDHVIPIATGHGGTTTGNMIPIKAELNKSKRDSNVFEWFDYAKERFNLDQTKFDELIDYLANINDMTVEEYRRRVYWCFENRRESAS